MKKILLLVSFLFLASCAPQVCEDVSCLKEALLTCSPASLTVDGEIPELHVGGKTSTTGTLNTTYVVNGIINDSCSYDVNQEVRGEQNVNVQTTCTIPQASLEPYVAGDERTVDQVANQFCKTNHLEILT